MENEDEIRVLVVGTTGSGISSTANTILNKNHFQIMKSGRSITLTSQEAETSQNICLTEFSPPSFVGQNEVKKRIIVRDNPGFYCTEISAKRVEDEIMKSVSYLYPGPNAILYVMRIGRLPADEEISISLFLRLFGKKVLPFVLLVCTYKENLEGNSLDQYIRTMPNYIKEFANNCGLGQIAINNRADKIENNRRIVQIICNHVKKDRYYSDDNINSSSFRWFNTQIRLFLENIKNFLCKSKVRILLCVGLFVFSLYGMMGFFSDKETGNTTSKYVLNK